MPLSNWKPKRSLLLQRLRLSVHRYRWYDLQRFALAPHQVVSRYFASLRSEEGYVGLPDSAHTRNRSYKTAWYLCHRIRAAMVESQKPMLDGKVEMDETYIGGKNWWQGKNSLAPRQGNCNRHPSARRRSPFLPCPRRQSGTLEKYIRENISEDVDVLFTDDSKAIVARQGTFGKMERHKTIRHKLRVYAKGDIHTNTVESAFSLLSAASWELGTESARNISKPTAKK